MEITTEALDIKQDTAREQFRFDMKGDEDVFMQYAIRTKPSPSVLEIQKTYVPDVLSSIGIEEAMALQAVRFADKMGYRIKATCPFMSGYLNRHPEFNNMRAPQ